MAVLDGVSYANLVTYFPLRTDRTCCLQPMDLACVETQIGDGSPLDCEIVTLDNQDILPVVRLLD